MKTALVAGGTGLIGGQLLGLLLNDDRYGKVIAITRQPLSRTEPKFRNVVADPDTLVHFADDLRADDVFCCLGTIMKKAKTKEAFQRVDFAYPLALARLSRDGGAHQFLIVSALGANKSSFIFYNRVKGETEEAIGKVGFESYHILRPSLLIGPRKEQRAGEEAAKWVYSMLGFLIPQKYKGIESIRVARAMIALASSNEKGTFVHESNELQQY